MSAPRIGTEYQREHAARYALHIRQQRRRGLEPMPLAGWLRLGRPLDRDCENCTHPIESHDRHSGCARADCTCVQFVLERERW